MALRLMRLARRGNRAGMFLRAWRVITVILVALSVGAVFAHVLEMPVKLGYDAELYSAVNTTLYRYFAIAGAPIVCGATLASIVLCFLVRRRGSAFRWTLVGTLLFCIGFAVWWTIVFPVNSEIAGIYRTAPANLPEAWMRLRHRWEWGHATSFVLYLASLVALLISVVRETPAIRGPVLERRC